MNYTELKRLAEAAKKLWTENSWFKSEMDCFRSPVWDSEDIDYIAAASPDVVLSMIAEIDYFQREVSMMKSEWNQFHHLMKKYGLHPGRTDDNLLDILDRDLEASKHGLHQLREKNVEARAERDKLRTQNQALIDSLSACRHETSDTSVYQIADRAIKQAEGGL